jgi:carbon monoxide dehydrogenase subunit G
LDVTDSREIRAAPETVWAALFDPEVLRQCIPGCESLKGTREEGYNAIIQAKAGPLDARLRVRLTVSDIVEGRTVTILGEGKGNTAGYISGTARVTLAPSDIGTRLGYMVKATVGSKVASLGAPLINRALRRLADRFFGNLQNALEPAGADETAGAAVGEAPRRGWFQRMMGS